MPLQYSVIEIYTSEGARCKNMPLHEAIMKHVKSLKIAARCTIIKGSEACYENGEIAAQHILNLSYNMPLKIEIVLPATELDTMLSTLETIVCEGILGVRQLDVISHKTKKHLFPPQIKVKDVMTPNPHKAHVDTPVNEILKTLLSYTFTGMPVIDDENRPVGVISQTDLIYRAKMPIRLSLMAKSDPENLEKVMKPLSHITAGEIMTSPAVHIQEDELLTEAVNTMLKNNVKRLPVVNAWGKLTGILSRLDIFMTITRESPDWKEIRQRNIVVDNIHCVSEIMRRDARTVLPDTPIEDVIRIIDSSDIRRVAVVSEDGTFMGMISDRNLLGAFATEAKGLWDYLAGIISFGEKNEQHKNLSNKLKGKKAKDIMRTDLITVDETATIDEVIAIITENGIKRLPVVDPSGKYKGMISRESLLSIGFSGENDSI